MEAPAAGKAEPTLLTFARGPSPPVVGRAIGSYAPLTVSSGATPEVSPCFPQGSHQKRGARWGCAGRGSPRPSSWETPSEVDNLFLDICLHLPARGSDGRVGSLLSCSFPRFLLAAYLPAWF